MIGLQVLSEAPSTSWTTFGVVLAVAVGGALLLHALVYGVLHRIRRRAPEKLPLDGHLISQTDRAMRWTLLAIAAQVAFAYLPGLVVPGAQAVLSAVLYIGLVLAVAWLAIETVSAVRHALSYRLDLEKDDNLSERRLLTQVGLLQRLLS